MKFRNMREICVQLCVLLLGLSLTDGFIFYATERCIFNSSEPEDIQLIFSFFYNKREVFRYDSNVKKFEGYPVGIKYASTPHWIDFFKHEKDRYCVSTVPFYQNILSLTAKPYAVLNSAPSGGSEGGVICSVYGFFPKDISVSWTNHHQPIHSGVTETDLLPDSDWFYQLHSHLEYTPRSGDQISCVIEHPSLSEPMVLDWKEGLSDGDRNKIAIGTSGLVLGLVLSLSGFIFYKRKAPGRPGE